MQKIKKINGFTLIELMVALTIFLVVSLIATSIFITSVKSQRKALIDQRLQDNARYIIETLSKEIRMSEIDTGDGSFNELRAKTFNTSDPDGVTVDYRFQNNEIQRKEQGAGGGWPAINSSEVKVSGHFFIVKNNNVQPRVTITLLVSPKNSDEPKIQLQNTVTSRIYK